MANETGSASYQNVDKALWIEATLSGHQILVDKSSIKGGKKYAIHEFVNSDFRAVEFLGKLPPIFTMDLLIYGDSVEDYDEKRDVLIDIVERDEETNFEHPTQGDVNVTCTEYTLDETDREYGLGRMSITLYQSDNALAAPQQTGLTASEVRIGIEIAKVELSLSTLDKLKGVGKGIVQSLSGMMENITGAFDNVISFVGPIKETLDRTRSIVDGFKASVANMLSLPSLVGGSIKGLFTSIESAFDDTISGISGLGDSITGSLGIGRGSSSREFPTSAYIDRTNPSIVTLRPIAPAFDPAAKKFDAIQTLFEFQDDIIPPTLSAAGVQSIPNKNADIVSNEAVIRTHIQAGAVLEMFDSALDVDFSNTDELEGALSVIENQYDKIIGSIDADSGAIASNNVVNQPFQMTEGALEAFKNVRESFLRYMSNQKANVPNVVDFVVQGTQPMSKISFLLYGNQDKTQDLIDLNNTFEPTFVTGAIKVYGPIS